MGNLPEIQPLEPRRETQREKKRSGLAWFFGSAPEAGELASGGAGEGGFLARLFSPFLRLAAQGGAIFATTQGRLLMALLATLVSGANWWLHRGAADASAAALGRPPLFNGGAYARRGAYQEQDLWNSDLSKTPNSVGMVEKGKNLLGEDDAAAKAAAEAKAAAAQNAGGPGAMGNAGPLGDAKDAGAANLPPGAQLPDGPGQRDAADKLKAALANAKPVALPAAGKVGSSSALFGGVGRAFDSVKTLALKPFSGQARPQTVQTSRPAAMASHGRGPARKALDQAFGMGRIARGASNLGTAAVANGVVFDQTRPAGDAITGNGSAIDSIGVPNDTAKGDEYSKGGPTGGGSSGSSPGGGASAGPQADDCAAKFPDGGYVSTPEGGCAPDASHKNATPWQGQSDMSMMLTLIATIVLLIAEIIGKLAKSIKWLQAVAMMLAMVAAAMGAMIIMQGVMVMAQGQTSQGALYILTGTMITIAGVMCAMGEAKAYLGENAAKSGMSNIWTVIKSVF